MDRPQSHHAPGSEVEGHGDYPRLAKIIGTAREINDSMPEFVLERIYEIMVENNIEDINKIGFYGLTYKENVDDIRESPTLQILNSMEKHLAGRQVKVYDPMIQDDITYNQYHDLDLFLNEIEMIVILVAHDEIKENIDKLKGKIIFDTRKVSKLKGTYYL